MKPNVEKQTPLTHADVSRLLANPSAETRIEVAGKISLQFTQGDFTADELTIAEQIFRLLVRDTERRVRAVLAENLKEDPYVPRDIILSLAQDEVDVSIPVLLFSEVLTSEDLIGIIRATQSEGVLNAIAARREVDEQQAEAVIERGNVVPIRTLLKNRGSQIAEEGYHTIIRHHSGDREVMDCMALRENLPVTVVEKLISLVSQALGEAMADTYGLPAFLTHKAVEYSRERATLEILGPDAPQKEISRLVDQLAAFRRLTPSLMLTALALGYVDFFATALAKLGQISLTRAHTCIDCPHSISFYALYEKAQMPPSLLEGTATLLRCLKQVREEHKPSDPTFPAALKAALRKQHARKPIEKIDYILSLI